MHWKTKKIHTTHFIVLCDYWGCVGPNPQYLLSMPVFRKDPKEGVTQISKTLNGSKRKKGYFRFLGLLWQSTTTRGLEMMQIYSLLAVETKWELTFTRLKSEHWQGWFLMEALGGESISLLFPASRHSLLSWFIPDISLQLLTSLASLSSEDICDYIWSPLK